MDTSTAEALKALGDGKRLEIIHYLASHAEGQATVGEITASMDISQPAVSQHLKVLHAAGLVQASRKANFRIYRISMTRLRELNKAVRELYQVAVRSCPPEEKTALKTELSRENV